VIVRYARGARVTVRFARGAVYECVARGADYDFIIFAHLCIEPLFEKLLEKCL